MLKRNIFCIVMSVLLLATLCACEQPQALVTDEPQVLVETPAPVSENADAPTESALPDESAPSDEDLLSQQADELLLNMSVREKIGQVLLVDFRKWQAAGEEEAYPLTELNGEVESVIKDYNLGCIILFAENLSDTASAVRLTNAMQKAAAQSGNIPLLIGADQEGGIVTRLGQGTVLPGNMAVGATGYTQNAYKCGTILAEELSAVGINCDFAPVCDVNDNPQNPVINLRSFGSSAQSVSKYASMLCGGLQENGVIACAKHFPGHGSASTDTHTGLALVGKSHDEWSACEQLPFAAAIESGIDMIMTAHIQYPALDDTKYVSKQTGEEIYLPATLSKTILTDILRGEMGFEGVIVTDSMAMEAITDNFGEAEAVVMSLAAGADLMDMPTSLTCAGDVSKLEEIYSAIENAVSDGTLPEERLNDAARRVIMLKLKYGIADTAPMSEEEEDAAVEAAKATVGGEAHKAAEREISNAAITLYNPENHSVPLECAEDDTVLFVMPSNPLAKSAGFTLSRMMEEGKLTAANIDLYCYENEGDVTETLRAKLETADKIILGSALNSAALSDPSSWRLTCPQAICSEINDMGKSEQTAVISLNLPYDAVYFPDYPVYIAYGYIGLSEGADSAGVAFTHFAPNLPSAIEAAFGAFTPSGALSVSLQ